MDYSSYLVSYTPVAEKLRRYGFICKDSVWVLECDLPFKDLFAKIRITTSEFDVRVIDRNFNDDFLPFNIKDGNSSVKAVVQNLIDEILLQCFSNTKRDVIAYCEHTFQTKHENPWQEFPEFCTFKTVRSKKWYALIMNLPGSKLGLKDCKIVDVINLKLPPEQIQILVDGKHYFPAYHMNKKYWMTVLLDKNVDMEQLKTLIHVSYDLVEKKF